MLLLADQSRVVHGQRMAKHGADGEGAAEADDTDRDEAPGAARTVLRRRLSTAQCDQQRGAEGPVQQVDPVAFEPVPAAAQAQGQAKQQLDENERKDLVYAKKPAQQSRQGDAAKQCKEKLDSHLGVLSVDDEAARMLAQRPVGLSPAISSLFSGLFHQTACGVVRGELVPDPAPIRRIRRRCSVSCSSSAPEKLTVASGSTSSRQPAGSVPASGHSPRAKTVSRGRRARNAGAAAFGTSTTAQSTVGHASWRRGSAASAVSSPCAATTANRRGPCRACVCRRSAGSGHIDPASGLPGTGCTPAA